MTPHKEINNNSTDGIAFTTAGIASRQSSSHLCYADVNTQLSYLSQIRMLNRSTWRARGFKVIPLQALLTPCLSDTLS
jgi:hypothetical protein